MSVGFLPFHRIGNNAFPVGRFFNDAHNLIAAADHGISWDWLLQSLGLRSYAFHALTESDPQQFPAHTCHETIRSFRCDIGDDPAEYLRNLGSRHKTVGRQGQKTRKMAREVGPVHLELDCRSMDAFDQNFRWKRQQYARTNILDLFRLDWTLRLMRELFETPPSALGDSALNVQCEGNARGILSVLRAGDRIVASHFGILEGGLLHYWFPAYDPNYAKYSPGTGLFCSILSAAGQHGIRCVDMGYGEQPYKLKQTDSTGFVTKGCIARSVAYRRLRKIETKMIKVAKRLPNKEAVKRVCRSIWPSAGISKLN
ncbi:MAG: GNAT family N-acetyltransferase [Planctomycetales bacterium]|nr:GNAT family N-acetyltransferase [Planctomycetales bacterium]